MTLEKNIFKIHAAKIGKVLFDFKYNITMFKMNNILLNMHFFNFHKLCSKMSLSDLVRYEKLKHDLNTIGKSNPNPDQFRFTL